jgi:DNA-binding NtrC family response regulator
MAKHVTRTFVLDALGAARGVRQPVFRLRVVKGPWRRHQKEFREARVLVGSGTGADFRIEDPTVSALHCELTLGEEGFEVRDLGSKNGTHVGKVQVRQAMLAPGDLLTLGHSVVKLELRKEHVEHPLTPVSRFGKLVGTSWRMRELYLQLQKAAASDATVLLMGETGTGKELAAEALVEHGPRRDGPFVVIDCGALSSTLLESELFGHERGAFTGADREHAGAFERAHGGTVFLDEIGELGLEAQTKLLGVLERKQVQRMGGAAPIALDVRVIAATHRDLERRVNQGHFRADVYFRLAALPIRLPALRERQEDIPLLIAHFLEELAPTAELDPAALDRLRRLDYPGNVRELRNEVERAALGLAAASAAAGPTSRPADTAAPFRTEKARVVAAFERDYLGRLLESCEGNVTEAARRSGLDRVHLHRLLAKYGLKIRSMPR